MFVFILRYIVAAIITFAVIFTTAPILYMVWFDSLRDMNATPIGSIDVQATGDLFFSNFQIMSFVVPGIIIVWGFVSAVRKRIVEEEI